MIKVTSVLGLGVVIFTVGLVTAVTDEEKSNVRAAMVPILDSCGKELGISKEEMVAANQDENTDALNPCFFACVFKKMGTINDQGNYDAAVAKDTHRKYFKGQDDLALFDSISDVCNSVNDQTLSDGAKGCERAKLLVNCYKTNKGCFSPFSN